MGTGAPISSSAEKVFSVLYNSLEATENFSLLTAYKTYSDLATLSLPISQSNQNFTVALQSGIEECVNAPADQPQSIALYVDACNIVFLISKTINGVDSFSDYLEDYISINEDAVTQADLTPEEQEMISNTLAVSGFPEAFLTETSNFYGSFYSNGPIFKYFCPDLPGTVDECDDYPFGNATIIPYGTYSPNDPGFATVSAAEETGIDYTPLSQGIPGFDNGEEIGFGQFLAIMFNFLLIIAGVLAFVMLIIGAFQYMSIDSMSGKEGGKEKMMNALFGLLLALGAWIILNTINPNLTNNLGLTIEGIVLETGGDINIPGVSISNQSLQSTLDLIGAVCPGVGGPSVVASVAESFNNKVTYRLGGKGGPAPYPYETAQGCPGGACGSFCPAGQLCSDCSGFVHIVRQCAGIPSVGASTGTIFTTANGREDIAELTATAVNGVELVPGDILGWLAADSSNNVGHAIIYIGNGQAVESTSNGGPGRTIAGSAYKKRSVLHYGDRLKYVVRVN